MHKLFRLSVYSSILIAAVSILPLYATLKTVAPFFYFYLFVVFFINIFIIWLINISLVYFFEKLHHSPGKGNYLRYFLSFVVAVSVSGTFIMFVESLELLHVYIEDEDFLRLRERNRFAPFFSSFFTNAFVLFMQELVLLREKKTKVELENAQLRIEKAEAFNQQLKQHIHPHFLFNSLSVLKSLIHKDPEVAEEYVIRLSDFLRTSFSSNEAYVVKLKDELKMCNDFIEMQRIRFGEALKVSIDIPEALLNKGFVPGFSIQLLLENAIKHNALTANSPLEITIKENNGWLHISNNIQQKHSIEHSTKSGLANLSQRYKMISNHDIIIENSNESFDVQIKILDHEYRNH